jgi:peptide/nickel transport system ATP-binding protein
VVANTVTVAPPPQRASDPDDLLDIEDLRTYFATANGLVKAVDGVSLHIRQGKTLGVVGESGCGKSITALSIMRLIERPGRIVSGSIRFATQDLLKIKEADMREIRGNQISMIFQEPMTSLNPVYTCGDQVAEAVLKHRGGSKKAAMIRAVDMLSQVGIPDPKRRAKQYPQAL